MSARYIFNLPIGDWSGDGHNICDYYTISSNRPVEQVIEIYRELTKRFGTGLDSSFRDAPCSSYGHSFNKKWLDKVGLEFSQVKHLIDDYEFWDEHEMDLGFNLGPEEFAKMFILLINTHDSSFNLELIEDETPTFLVQGNIGYGCYE